MTSLLSILSTLLLFSAKVAAHSATEAAPVVTVKNGTYEGQFEPTYGTEYFLGMPYAQPPVKDLRFRVPASLNSSWSGTRNATEFGYQCIGYGRDTWSQGNYVSEDCLTLNVVKSRGSREGLPVLVWIHGGGYVMGGSSDNRYNQSFIVQQSEQAGMPIIAVSINYRLSSWGFLYGQEIQDSGNTMLGFRDQRLALQWVQENIAAFGGDPNKVTIQGESAGAFSVGVQLLAYGGRDDKLFSQAIAQSGAMLRPEAYPTPQSWAPVIANISAAVGCTNSSDLLDCLRSVPTDDLNAVLNSTATSGAVYGVVVDGDFISKPATVQMEKGEFVRVPFLLGCNHDEGVSFGPVGVNTTAEFNNYIAGLGYDNATAQDFDILYPDIPAIGIPGTFPGRPNGTFGTQYKRSSSLAGDLRQHTPRRLTAQTFAKYGVPMYSYRWNARANGVSWTQGAPHFQEVAFVFYNTQGLGYPQNGNPNPLAGNLANCVSNTEGSETRPDYQSEPTAQKLIFKSSQKNLVELSQLMVRQWISFVAFGNPNTKLGVPAAHWPKYTLESPKNFLFSENVTSHVEDDNYRAEGIQYISDLFSARRGRPCTGIVNCRN